MTDTTTRSQPATGDASGALKKETTPSTEPTYAGKTYTPAADIFETERQLVLVLDMPGVPRDHVNIRLENSVLEIEGRVDHGKYQGREALYSEYNVGNYYRRFTISNRIARDGIEARMTDGVLTLTLPKVAEATARRIPVA